MSVAPVTETSALVRAVQWAETVIFGPIATAFAVLAVASLGFAMLSGRLSMRRGLVAVLGCFITFGAPSIARGIVGLTQRRNATQGIAVLAPAPEPRLDIPAAKPAEVDDPYAGASVRN